MNTKENGTHRQASAASDRLITGGEANKCPLPNQDHIDLDERREAVAKLFTVLCWEDAVTAFIECPGKDLHTTGNAQQDCRVKIDGVPTVHCFHESCIAEVESSNLRLRQATSGRTVTPNGTAKPYKIKGPQDAAKSKSKPRLPFPAVALPAPIPEPRKRLLEAIFKPNEYVSIARTVIRTDAQTKEQSWIPGPSETYEFQEALRMQDFGDFQFFRVNPMNPKGTKDEHVAAYRHVLIDIDKDEAGQRIPLAVQYGALLASGLPITSIVFSGDKSLHALVRVDASNLEQFKQRKAKTYARINQFVKSDPKVGNPSRFSRLPGVMRNLSDPGQPPKYAEQTLLALNVGPSSWAEYEKLHPEEEPSLKESCYTATQQLSNTALQQQSNEAINYHALLLCEIAVEDLLPKDGKSHAAVSDGKENCIWRLCRRMLKFSEAGKNVDHAAVFESWYQAYQRWAGNVGVEPEPRSLLLNRFLIVKEKCKVPEGKTTPQEAWTRAQAAELPEETMPIRDDPKMCLFVVFLKELATLSNDGGRFFISCRDIAEFTGLFSPMEANRRLKILVSSGILRSVHRGFAGPHGKSAEFVYRPMNEPF
jgi:hypothetical protein